MKRLALVLSILAVTGAVAACGGDVGSSGEPAATTTQASTSSGGPGADGQPAIVVETPAPNTRVKSPLTVAGTADVFEANVTVVLLDGERKELARDFATATCGTGCRGDYSIDLPFVVDDEQPATVVVHDDDAAGTGTPPHVVEIPVTLSP
jgi:Immunoglobulin-like domain of bacterial spore germination